MAEQLHFFRDAVVNIEVFDLVILATAKLRPSGIIQKAGNARRLETRQDRLQRNIPLERMQVMRRAVFVFRRIGQIQTGILIVS